MQAPQATATTTGQRDALMLLFQNWANSSFEKSINSINEQGYFQHVLTKLEAGADLTTDLPELKKVSLAEARAVIKRLKKQAEEQIEGAWLLKPSVAKLFRTTVRSRVDEAELIPVFDVEYKTQTDKGAVTVAVKTWRRNISVTLSGTPTAIEKAYGVVVTAGLRA